MSKAAVVQEQVRIPTEYREKILGDLGKDTDQAIADKWSRKLGITIDRHAIFWMRKQEQIGAYVDRPYTKPKFRGRLEDSHPEVERLFGKVSVTAIAKHYKVSRSCARAAGKRLGFKEPGNVNTKKTIRELLSE